MNERWRDRAVGRERNPGSEKRGERASTGEAYGGRHPDPALGAIAAAETACRYAIPAAKAPDAARRHPQAVRSWSFRALERL